MIYDKVRTLFRRLGWPTLSEFDLALKTYDRRARLRLAGIGALFLIGLIGFIFSGNNYFLVTVAAPGGSLTEGIVGAPRFINPLLATSDSDRDLTMLTYAGLLRSDSQGNLVPDIARSYSVSADGLTYTFILKNKLRWSDGEPLTTADIAFTIEKAQDANIKSVKRANWEGVAVTVRSPEKIEFSLAKPYAGFLANATLGILPRHIWTGIRAEDFALTEKNINPIGSGPYKIKTVEKDGSGIPRQYNLIPFRYASAGRPKIANLRLNIYSNEQNLLDAYRRGEIESLAAISPDQAAELTATGANILSLPISRIFAVFFNQSGSAILANKEIRQALNLATDKEAIINQVFHGYAIPIDYPIPPGSNGYLKREAAGADLAKAKQILTKAGWQLDKNGLLTKTSKTGKKTSQQTLSFTLATANTPELKQTAELLARDWRALDAKVTVQIYESSDLAQNIIQTRKYDALLFGEVLAHDPDLFPYWHSSQRNYPGLNVSMYANQTVDKLIEEARSTTDETARRAKYLAIQREIAKDTPAIFLYTPNFIYLVPTKVKNIIPASLITASERFRSISDWYIVTDRVWRVFANANDLVKK